VGSPATAVCTCPTGYPAGSTRCETATNKCPVGQYETKDNSGTNSTVYNGGCIDAADCAETANVTAATCTCTTATHVWKATTGCGAP